MNVEAVLLTGGASSRMGQDKGSIQIDGIPLARRIAQSLTECGIHVTVLGREPLEPYAFLRDEEEYQGPLVALHKFRPSRDWVFVVSCDLPFFNPDLVFALMARGEEAEAVIPKVDERLQPLAAVYRGTAFSKIEAVLDSGKRSMMAWVNLLAFQFFEPSELGFDPMSVNGANTPEELADLLRQQGRVQCLDIDN